MIKERKSSVMELILPQVDYNYLEFYILSSTVDFAGVFNLFKRKQELGTRNFYYKLSIRTFRIVVNIYGIPFLYTTNSSCIVVCQICLKNPMIITSIGRCARSGCCSTWCREEISRQTSRRTNRP